jgi:3-phenylpropionate/trans-cinnamate dioxygenase ferredoxin reductase subunit
MSNTLGIQDMGKDSIVVIGGGHAGAQICASLAELGQGQRVHLVCEESVLPYQRPPLSKAFFKKDDETVQVIRAQSWFDQQGIQVHLGDAVKSIDLTQQVVHLSSGQSVAFSKLVFATGTRPRRLPELGPELENVHLLRTAQDAQTLRSQLANTQSVTFIGGGFIGLELAATLKALGKEVTVLEVGSRLLARSISMELSAHVLKTHRAAGLDIRLQSVISGYKTESHQLTHLALQDQELKVQRVLLGIGAQADTALAQSIGLACDGAIVVDDQMRTSLPNVWAIGDCTVFPYGPTGAGLRLESIQNANDQAKVAAQSIMGQPVSYKPTPWFWSEQGAMRLQMVGLLPPSPKTIKRPGANEQSFSLFHYDQDRLACVESVNAVMDHMMAKKFFELGCNPSPEEVANPELALKSLAV